MLSLCLIWHLWTWTTFTTSTETEKREDRLLVLTVATARTDGLKRLEKSLENFGFEYHVVGMGRQWNGGDVQKTVGGGQKINILKEYLSTLDTSNSDIILYLDGYDVIVNSDEDEVMEKFKQSGKRVLFGAEVSCWPKKELESQYPEVPAKHHRFLNSGGFIGYRKDVEKMLNHKTIKDSDDDQLFYTEYFLNHVKKRENDVIGMDTRANLFMNLNWASHNVRLDYVNESTVVINDPTGTMPCIIHGNGPSKIGLNRIGNYLGGTWSPSSGCMSCTDDTYDLHTKSRKQWPLLVVQVTVKQPTPFVDAFINKFQKLDYPKEKMHLIIMNVEERWDPLLEEFTKQRGEAYGSVEIMNNTTENTLFEHARDRCNVIDCSHVLLLDATAHLDHDEALSYLLGLNRTVIAPILKRSDLLFSNFWGSVTTDGYYDRSDDYVLIVNGERIGIWNVPFITSCILIQSDMLHQINVTRTGQSRDFDVDFTKFLRDNGIFMWATNLLDFGHLINTDNYNQSRLHPELYEIFHNIEDWKQQYLHHHFYEYLNQKIIPQEEWQQRYLNVENATKDRFFIHQPCSDIYWYPILSERYTTELINTVETSNMWSLGKHKDERIPGGYENVPTDDVHMTQIGFQEHWLHFLKKFIQPIQMRIFLGYYSDPPKAPLSFVVRYQTEGQDHLRPHHDASTYTLDIALNQPGRDYEGGGVRYIRYNCSLIDTPVGWTLMFPGRLTHLHEGLKITRGKRYIFVSFIDP